MLALLGLQYWPNDALILLAMGAVFGATIVGFATDSLMGGLGFGLVGNGLTALAGAALGLALWRRFFPPVSPDQPLPLILFVVGAAFTTLLTLVLARRFV